MGKKYTRHTGRVKYFNNDFDMNTNLKFWLMKNLNFFMKTLVAVMLLMSMSWGVKAQDRDSTTWLDFETLSSDTSFQDLGELDRLPLNWVFDTKDPDGTNHIPSVGAVPVLTDDGIAGKAMEFDGAKYWVLLQKPYDVHDPFGLERKEKKNRRQSDVCQDFIV